MTAQIRIGVLQRDNVARQFIPTDFHARRLIFRAIYRQCSGPNSLLVLVVKDPGYNSQGAEWREVKSGKLPQRLYF